MIEIVNNPHTSLRYNSTRWTASDGDVGGRSVGGSVGLGGCRMARNHRALITHMLGEAWRY